MQASAAAQEVDFVFDRLLDGDRIEDVVTQNGVETTVPKATRPSRSPGPTPPTAMSTPPFSDQVGYNSEPFYGAATAYVLLQPAVVGFPSADTITFSLDKANLTSAYGDQMTGPSQIPGDHGAVFGLVSTRGGRRRFDLGADEVLSPGRLLQPRGGRRGHRTVRPCRGQRPAGAGGAGGNASDLTIVYLSAAGCLGGWPVGVPIDVTIAAGNPTPSGSRWPVTPTRPSWPAAWRRSPLTAAALSATDGGVG